MPYQTIHFKSSTSSRFKHTVAKAEIGVGGGRPGPYRKWGAGVEKTPAFRPEMNRTPAGYAKIYIF